MRKRIQSNENPRSEKPQRFSGERREFKPRFENRDNSRNERRETRDNSRDERRETRDERGSRGERREFKPRFNSEGGEKREYKPRFNSENRGDSRNERPETRIENRNERRETRDERGPRDANREGKPKFEKRDAAAHFEEKKKQFRDRADRKFGKSGEEKEEGFKKRFSPRDTFKSRSRHDESTGFTPNYRIDRFKENAPSKIQRKIAQQEKKSDHVRLNRFIANAGICSRRDADKLIESGEIKVNNKVVTEMGFQVGPTDVVRYGNRKLNREKPVYVLLNKPKDFITTTEDPNDRKTVMELVKNAGDARIYPVGRLDRNTTGLLLLTNDGELADRLTHPSNEIEKIYQAELDKPLTEEDFTKILAGLKLEDGEIKVDDLARVTPDGYVIGVKIHSGKNRIVRRIFEHLGYEVTKLDRTTFAGLSKKDLPRGNWRFLTEREVIKLKYLM